MDVFHARILCNPNLAKLLFMHVIQENHTLASKVSALGIPSEMTVLKGKRGKIRFNALVQITGQDSAVFELISGESDLRDMLKDLRATYPDCPTSNSWFGFGGLSPTQQARFDKIPGPKTEWVVI